MAKARRCAFSPHTGTSRISDLSRANRELTQKVVDFRARCNKLSSEKRHLESTLRTEARVQSHMESDAVKAMREKLSAAEESVRKHSEINCVLKSQLASLQRSQSGTACAWAAVASGGSTSSYSSLVSTSGVVNSNSAADDIGGFHPPPPSRSARSSRGSGGSINPGCSSQDGSAGFSGDFSAEDVEYNTGRSAPPAPTGPRIMQGGVPLAGPFTRSSLSSAVATSPPAGATASMPPPAGPAAVRGSASGFAPGTRSWQRPAGPPGPPGPGTKDAALVLRSAAVPASAAAAVSAVTLLTPAHGLANGDADGTLRAHMVHRVDSGLRRASAGTLSDGADMSPTAASLPCEEDESAPSDSPCTMRHGVVPSLAFGSSPSRGPGSVGSMGGNSVGGCSAVGGGVQDDCLGSARSETMHSMVDKINQGVASLLPLGATALAERGGSRANHDAWGHTAQSKARQPATQLMASTTATSAAMATPPETASPVRTKGPRDLRETDTSPLLAIGEETSSADGVGQTSTCSSTMSDVGGSNSSVPSQNVVLGELDRASRLLAAALGEEVRQARAELQSRSERICAQDQEISVLRARLQHAEQRVRDLEHSVSGISEGSATASTQSRGPCRPQGWPLPHSPSPPSTVTMSATSTPISRPRACSPRASPSEIKRLRPSPWFSWANAAPDGRPSASHQPSARAGGASGSHGHNSLACISAPASPAVKPVVSHMRVPSAPALGHLTPVTALPAVSPSNSSAASRQWQPVSHVAPPSVTALAAQAAAAAAAAARAQSVVVPPAVAPMVATARCVRSISVPLLRTSAASRSPSPASRPPSSPPSLVRRGNDLYLKIRDLPPRLSPGDSGPVWRSHWQLVNGSRDGTPSPKR